jgi:hypothetical protein
VAEPPPPIEELETALLVIDRLIDALESLRPDETALTKPT